MAKVYSTGPALVFTDAMDGTPGFFGTFQQAPDINIQAAFDQVINDLAGTKLPFDRLYEGEEAITSGVINRYNEDDLQAMMARPNPVLSTPGTSSSGEIGTLMNQENMTYTVWILFPYATKTFQVADAVKGYRFPHSFLLGPEQIKGGSKDKQTQITWQHMRGWTLTDGMNPPSPGVGSFLLYDNNMSAVASVPID